MDQVVSQLNVFCSGESHWILKKLPAFHIKFCHTKFLSGKSYMLTQPKPKGMRKGLLKIKETLCDNFASAIVSFRSFSSHRQSHQRNKIDNLMFSELMMHIKPNDTLKLENDNKVSITVFVVEGSCPDIFIFFFSNWLNSQHCWIIFCQVFMHKVR